MMAAVEAVPLRWPRSATEISIHRAINQLPDFGTDRPRISTTRDEETCAVACGTSDKALGDNGRS